MHTENQLPGLAKTALIVIRVVRVNWVWGKMGHFVEPTNARTKNSIEQEGFLRCQTLTSSTIRRKVEGCLLKNGGCRIESEEGRV